MRRVCVFCGSSPGARPAYADAARSLGRTLAERGTGLVYGGGKVGLMGVVADATLAAGGEAIGVIPRALEAREVAHAGLTRLEVVESMHERKARMAELADGFVALPGGLGTLAELFEVATWAQLGVHEKPCGVLEVDGYWRGLLAFLDRAVEERFLRPEHRDLLVVAEGAGPMLEALDRWRPPAVPKWIDASET